MIAAMRLVLTRIPLSARAMRIFFGTESLGTVIKNLLYQPHKPRLLLIALAAVGPAEDVVVEGSAGNIQRFTEFVDTIRVVWLLVEAFQEDQLFSVRAHLICTP